MRDFDNDFDRAIGARFGVLHGSVAAAVRRPPAEEIIARGRRRRRNGQAVLGGLTVLGVLAVGALVFGPLGPDGGPLPPIDPTTSPSPAYVPPPGAARAPLGGAIPAGFLPGGRAGGRLEPLCPGPASLPSNASILASASAEGTALIAYPDGITASRAYGEYRAEAMRCAAPDSQVELTVDELTFGAQGSRVVVSAGTKAMRYEAVIRYGRALLLVRGPTDAVVRRAGVLERSMCVFATDCAPRGGRPDPLAPLTAGGQAWAVVLATEADPGADAPALGHAVAAASEMGYRTSVTSVDCDDGARAALGLPAGSAYRYVAVYFGSRADADAFASRASPRPVATIPVRTYCLG